MPKYIPVADKIAEGLFAAKNRLFDFVQKSLDEGKEEKEIMKTIKETLTADPAVLSEIEYTFFKKKDKSASIASVVPIKQVSINPYRTKKAVDVTELFKEYDAIMDAATDMHTEGIISDEEYTSIDKAHKSLDDPAHIVSYLEELKELMEKAMATNKAASWIDDAKVGDQVELNDEIGEVTYMGDDKIEVKTPTKTETIWKN